MNTILTMHLVDVQPIFLFILFITGNLVTVSTMLAVKSSRYKDLRDGHDRLDELLLKAELTNKELTEEHKKELTEKERVIQAMRDAVRNMEVSYNGIINAWKGKYSKLESTIPKPRERDSDGKFVKGSSRLDNLRKHLLEGNRTDRFTAQESFGIAHVGKFISTLKKEGFDIRKEKRKIAKDSFLTEYYLVPEQGPREWKPIEEDGVQTESAMNMGRTLAMGECNKSITFDKAAQDAIPKDVRARMDADRKQAEERKATKPKHQLTHGLTVEKPSKEDAKEILTAAGESGLLCLHGRNELDDICHSMWYNERGMYVGVTSCAIIDRNERTFVTAQEFIARMQPQQTNA